MNKNLLIIILASIFMLSCEHEKVSNTNTSSFLQLEVLSLGSTKAILDGNLEQNLATIQRRNSYIAVYVTDADYVPYAHGILEGTLPNDPAHATLRYGFNGTWVEAPETGAEIFYLGAPDGYAYAYYPYFTADKVIPHSGSASGDINAKVHVKLDSGEDSTDVDYMFYFEQTNTLRTVSSQDTKLAIKFKHAMSMLTFAFYLDQTYLFGDVALLNSFSILNSENNGPIQIDSDSYPLYMNISSGLLTGGSRRKDEGIVRKNLVGEDGSAKPLRTINQALLTGDDVPLFAEINSESKYSILVAPSTIFQDNKCKVVFNIDGFDYIYSLPGATWEAGKHYSYVVKLSSTGFTVDTALQVQEWQAPLNVDVQVTHPDKTL